MSSDNSSPGPAEDISVEAPEELDTSPPEDTFRILLATDNHLGYMEKDGERFHDSFDTFEEILEMAGGLQVDFILLGGDLFHENRPSLRTMHRCMELLRQYSLNSKPVQFQILSDQSVNFSHSTPFPLVNYEDPNLNVGFPVFSIHGNHDDPLGPGGVCALDLFHAAGLVNLFGKVCSVEKVKLTPILLKKGKTRIALYGLGACKDERLHRLLVGGQVEFLRPVDDPHQDNDWFCILVIHQNRARHGATNYIPESLLPDFLHLVVWGHEHECRIRPEWQASRGFYVSQPGSSVATSLSQGEAGPKAVGLIEIHGSKFRLSSTPLRTVRPFVMEDLLLDAEADFAPDDKDMSKKVETLCTTKVNQLIEESKEKLSGHPKQPSIPLIRLRVDYSGGYESFSAQRFGQKFVGRVANPKDLLIFHRRREKEAGHGGGGGVAGQSGRVTAPDQGNLSAERVEGMVRQFFETAGEDFQLSLLVEKVIGAGVTAFVDKNASDAIGVAVQRQVTQARSHLEEGHPLEEDVLEEVSRYRDILSTSVDDSDLDFSVSAVVSTVDASLVSSVVSGRGARGGTRTTRGRTSAKSKQGTIEASFSRAKVKDEEDEEDLICIDSSDGSDEPASLSTSLRGGRERGSRGGVTKATRGSRGGGKKSGAAGGRKRTARFDSDESSEDDLICLDVKNKKRKV